MLNITVPALHLRPSASSADTLLDFGHFGHCCAEPLSGVMRCEMCSNPCRLRRTALQQNILDSLLYSVFTTLES